ALTKNCASQVSQDIFALIQSLLSPTRKLICQGNVVLQTGLQTQERFLILFSDLLIITKAKSVMQVKQKKCVRVSEMWTASCVDEVCEASTASERSFVMGWPTYNCVATFSISEEKDRWLSLIQSCIQEEKQSDNPKMIPLKILAKDVGNCAYAKTLFISNTDCTSDVIGTALQQFGLSGGIKDYKLWVCSKQDETPYPLIGHEFPYSIKMSHIRLLQQDAVTLSYSQMALLPIDAHCQFFLRPSQMSSTFTGDMIISIYNNSITIKPLVFLKDMLKCLCREGAVTHGIFRRSAGVKACRELREKLDSGHYEEPLSGEPVLVTASVFKVDIYVCKLFKITTTTHFHTISFTMFLKMYSLYISFLFPPLVGSLQQMSDSGYESLKNEVNTDTEDISKSRPLKDSRSMDSLMSLSDCDLDIPENHLPSSTPLAQLRNFSPAVRQLRSLKLYRRSMSTIALTSHQQEVTLESGKHEEFKRPDEVNDNLLLELSFQQLNFMREKQTPPTSNVSSAGTSPTHSSVSSIDSPFSLSTRMTRHSPQDSPDKGQSDLLAQNGADYQNSNSLPNEKSSPPHHQRNVTNIEISLQCKVPQNPPPYQQAFQKLNRKPFSQTPTQIPSHKGKGLFYRGPGSPTHSPLGDPNVSSDPQTVRFSCQTRTEEEVKLPQSVFYGQSCNLTVHKVREQNAGLKSSKLSGEQLRFKALDLHPSSGKIVGDYFMDASPLREKQAQRLSCCSSSQWIV
uniref:Rho GTPase-activating protein 20-like n=1 Tax=Sinocyclocheilus rhinocerous TaxID=307959 RepID=A0A673KL95_9TELE